ncbi:HEPN domain-containing protein [bacterium]|nr:HEPN domain-containing protein [bacterium]
MPVNNNPKLFQEWIIKAQNDLRAAEILYREKGPSDTLCFHCHQAVEKYLKGFLVFNRKRFPKVHDLMFLMNLCKEIDRDFQQLKDDLITLNKYYIESRYPPEIRVYSRQECKKILSLAEKLTQLIANKII